MEERISAKTSKLQKKKSLLLNQGSSTNKFGYCSDLKQENWLFLFSCNLDKTNFKISQDKWGENGELKEVYQRELQVFVNIVDTYNKDLSPLSIDFSVFDFYFVK